MGHWKLPPKLIWSTARWRSRQFPQILVLLEAIQGLVRSLKVIAQAMAPRVCHPVWGVVHMDMPLMILIRWYLYRLMPMPPRMYRRFYIHLIWYAYRGAIHKVR